MSGRLAAQGQDLSLTEASGCAIVCAAKALEIVTRKDYDRRLESRLAKSEGLLG